MSTTELISLELAKDSQTDSQTDNHAEKLKPEKIKPELIERVQFEPSRYRFVARTRSETKMFVFRPGAEYATIRAAEAAANEWFRKQIPDID